MTCLSHLRAFDSWKIAWTQDECLHEVSAPNRFFCLLAMIFVRKKTSATFSSWCLKHHRLTALHPYFEHKESFTIYEVSKVSRLLDFLGTWNPCFCLNITFNMKTPKTTVALNHRTQPRSCSSNWRFRKSPLCLWLNLLTQSRRSSLVGCTIGSYCTSAMLVT